MKSNNTKHAQRVGAFVAACVFGMTTLTWADAPELTVLINDTFESDPINPSLRAALGTDPAGWSAAQVANGNGVVDISVEGVGSPFGGGSARSMLFYDNNSVDPRMDAVRSFAPQTNIEIKVSVDLRINAPLMGSDSGMLNFNVLIESGAGAAFWRLGTDGSSVALISGVGSTLQFMTPGDWYRLSLLMAPASSSVPSLDLQVIHLASSTTNTYTYARSGVSFTEGYGLIDITGGFGPLGLADVNVDNVFVQAIPEPGASALAAAALAGWIRRRREWR